ncbi:MAG: polysaccharide deacetylase family protein [Candidatus Eremiobacteraeota bacterium]|nr:polysaccharide deacetylase family protein [Candidatus Eremiobacteraeota bacterium]
MLFASFVEMRRWVHHAQLELVPAIVPATLDAAAIAHPPAQELASRMRRDIADVLTPPRRERLAVLTFDDGPYPVTTPALLATLRRLAVSADFFLIGDDAREQPDIAFRLAQAGMELGNHTLTHPEMSTLSFPAQLEEIVDGAVTIRRVTGRVTTYFRPPHGNFDEATLQAAKAAGETVALWNVDAGDWRTVTPADVVTRVVAQARSPAVILLHNGKEPTIQALADIVSAYRRAGFTFVTLSELQRRLPIDAINDPVRITLR